MRSEVSAGFRFSKYVPESGGTHFPPMKFLNVVGMREGQEQTQ